jgi:hypothetical protein
MQGDFSRFSFDPHKHYTAVRMQQGRVQLDADWNEQVDILRYELETQLKDLIGAAGGPAGDLGFEIQLERAKKEAHDSKEAEDDSRRRPPAASLADFEIGAGRYYVQGVRCENEHPLRFSRQPDFPGASLPEEASESERYLVYLDVWQRHLTSIEDPDLREVALGGADTTTRTRTVWQVKLLALEAGDDEPDEKRDVLEEWRAFEELKSATARMRARRTRSSVGLDNQLYRVEIHAVDAGRVSYKWSRDNGSIAFPLVGIEPGAAARHWVVSLPGLERDTLALKAGDWVELADDVAVLNGISGPLLQVESIDSVHSQVLVQAASDLELEFFSDPSRHPLLRRWDQNEAKNGALHDGALTLDQEDGWIALENGIEVSFTRGGQYHPGDYWTIPARSLTASIEWPQTKSGPQARPPHGIRHHYSLLAELGFGKEGWQVTQDFRRVFVPAPVVEREDLTVLREQRSDRAALSKIETALVEMAEELEVLRNELGRERDQLYQDMRSTERLEEGDVVAMDPRHRQRVVRANDDNETLVLGVVGEVFDDLPEGDHRVRVITYGRVSGRVLGPVRAGDMLVPAEQDGCAHKGGVIIRPGTLIGKALESYEPADRDKPGRIELFVQLG